MESRVPWRGSQGHSSSDGTTGKLYLTKCQGPAQPQRFPEYTWSRRVGTQLPTFSGGLGCAFGEWHWLYEDYLSPPAREAGGVCFWDQHKARFGSPVPVGAAWPCDSYVCPSTNNSSSIWFSPLQPSFSSLWRDMDLQPSDFAFLLSFFLAPIALIPVLSEQHASLKVPRGLTSLTRGPKFLVQSSYLLLPSPA